MKTETIHHAFENYTSSFSYIIHNCVFISNSRLGRWNNKCHPWAGTHLSSSIMINWGIRWWKNFHIINLMNCSLHIGVQICLLTNHELINQEKYKHKIHVGKYLCCSIHTLNINILIAIHHIGHEGLTHTTEYNRIDRIQLILYDFLVFFIVPLRTIINFSTHQIFKIIHCYQIIF